MDSVFFATKPALLPWWRRGGDLNAKAVNNSNEEVYATSALRVDESMFAPSKRCTRSKNVVRVEVSYVHRYCQYRRAQGKFRWASSRTSGRFV
jgi:hypothetical protein